MSLFRDRFPDVDSQAALERLLAENADLDPYYVASGSIPVRRERFESLWESFQPHADRHYLTEVRRSFHARTWEMYVAVTLMAKGLTIESSDRGPDVRVVSPTRFSVEAVAPTRGTGQDAVPSVQFDVVQDVPSDQVLLRLTAVMQEKRQKLAGYVEGGVVPEDEPLVVAVNSGTLGYPEDDTMPLMARCVFGLGNLEIPLAGGEPYWSGRTEVRKVAGAGVALGLFQDPAFSHVSAVLYSRTNVLNHPEHIGEDCVLIHNPMARNPLTLDVLAFFRQGWVDGDYLRWEQPAS